MGFTVDIPTPLNIPNSAVKRDQNSTFDITTVHGNLDGNAASADDGVVSVSGSNGLTLLLSNKTITGEIDPTLINSQLTLYSNGSLVGKESSLNFIAGDNISFSFLNDTPNSRINITISVNSPLPIVSGGVSGDIVVLNASGFALDSGLKIADIQDKNYVHEQLSSSSFWTVNHNLGKFPSVTVVDSGGTVVIGDITYIDQESLTISFSSAFAGVAYIN